jgi:hypothetical protein
MMQTQTYAYGPVGKALCALATNAVDDKETKNKKNKTIEKKKIYFSFIFPYVAFIFQI